VPPVQVLLQELQVLLQVPLQQVLRLLLLPLLPHHKLFR
jgi:hypothetical protein